MENTPMRMTVSLELRMTVSLERSKSRPDYKKTSGMLLTLCRDFYREPENEAAFQEWKKARKEAAG